jgi:hypothetical protein
MMTIQLSTHIHAPRERVLDLARSIDLHTRSLDWTREEPVAGRIVKSPRMNDVLCRADRVIIPM